MKHYTTYFLKTEYDVNGVPVMHFIITVNDPDCTIENFITNIAKNKPTQHSSFLLGNTEIANAYNGAVTFHYPHSSGIFKHTMKIACYAIGNSVHMEYAIAMEGGFNG